MGREALDDHPLSSSSSSSSTTSRPYSSSRSIHAAIPSGAALTQTNSSLDTMSNTIDLTLDSPPRPAITLPVGSSSNSTSTQDQGQSGSSSSAAAPSGSGSDSGSSRRPMRSSASDDGFEISHMSEGAQRAADAARAARQAQMMQTEDSVRWRQSESLCQAHTQIELTPYSFSTPALRLSDLRGTRATPTSTNFCSGGWCVLLLLIIIIGN